MKLITWNKKRLAVASVLTIGLTLIAVFGIAKRSDAFTLIELLASPPPVTLTSDQGARFLVNNTFGMQEIHVEINWGDGTTGAPIGSAITGNLLPGHGMTVLLPAVQTPGTAALTTRAIIVVCKLSPAPGATTGLPADAAKRIRASLEVFDKASPKTLIGLGLASAPLVVN